MKTRTPDQRKVYAVRRISAAVDRFIRAATLAEKQRAHRWAEAWARAGGLKR